MAGRSASDASVSDASGPTHRSRRTLIQFASDRLNVLTAESLDTSGHRHRFEAALPDPDTHGLLRHTEDIGGLTNCQKLRNLSHGQQ